jgi:hypothetical protein
VAFSEYANFTHATAWLPRAVHATVIIHANAILATIRKFLCIMKKRKLLGGLYSLVKR